MNTEKTLLILRLVEEKKITPEDAMILITPDAPLVDVKPYESYIPKCDPWITPPIPSTDGTFVTYRAQA